MLEEVSEFAASLNFTMPYWLTLTGPSGIGKTMMAKAVWRQFMNENRFELKLDVKRQRILGNTCAFVNWRKTCATLKGGDYEFIEDLCEEWFVILDDVGTEYDPSGFLASKLDEICNARLGKWTLITSNKSLQDLARGVDTRIASRMLRDGNKVVECFDVPDYNTR